MENFFRKVWDWIKENPAMVLAIGVGAFALYYLVFRGSGSSSSGQPATSVSFPPSGGGGSSGGSSGGTSSTAPAPITLPFSPDFSVLSAISDAGLRALYEQEYNLQEQIDAATLNGNTSLVNTLTNSLNGVEQQIASYVPASSSSTSGSGILPVPPGGGIVPPSGMGIGPGAPPGGNGFIGPPGHPPGWQPPGSGGSGSGGSGSGGQNPSIVTSAQLTQFQQDYLNSVGNTTDPLTAFGQWMAAMTTAAPQAVSALTQQQWYSVFNTFNQAAAFNPNNPYKNPNNALSYINNAVSNPNSIVGANSLLFYNGSQVYQWANGQVSNVTSQYAPAVPAAQTSNNMASLSRGIS